MMKIALYSALMDTLNPPLQIISVQGARVRLVWQGKVVSAYVSSQANTRWVTLDGKTYRLQKQTKTSRRAAESPQAGALIAPMPGQVRAVLVQAGQWVQAGQTLAMLEAMKMEIKILAPFAATVAQVFVQTGQTIERQETLFQLTPQETE